MMDVQAQIEADLSVANRLIRTWLEQFYNGTEQHEPAHEHFGEDVRIVNWMMIPVINFTEEDGREAETTLPMATTKSAAMKYGILELARQTLDMDAE